MIDKLNIVKQRFDEVSDLIIQPDVIADQKRYVELTKEYSDLKELVAKRAEYLEINDNLKEAEEIIADGSDAEMVEMAKMQLDEAKERLPQLEEEIKFLLIPKDPEDAKDVVVEIRRVPVVMRPVFLLGGTFLECTRNTARQKVGKPM